MKYRLLVKSSVLAVLLTLSLLSGEFAEHAVKVGDLSVEISANPLRRSNPGTEIKD